MNKMLVAFAFRSLTVFVHAFLLNNKDLKRKTIKQSKYIDLFGDNICATYMHYICTGQITSFKNIQCCSITHTLRLLCKFSRADDAVYPSSFKAACYGLSVLSKLAVVLFSWHSGFFPQGKNRLQPLRWHDLFVSSVRFGNSH